MSVAVTHGSSESAWSLGGDALANATDHEWLLTNGLGGYALGSASGTPTRRYHGLLIAAMSAPVERVSCVSAIDDAVVVNVGSPEQRRVRLTRFQFRDDESPPNQPQTLVRFERDTVGVRWIHTICEGGVEVTIEKTLHLYDHRNAARIKYAVRSAGIPIRLELRPIIRLMDHHHLSLLESDDPNPVQTREIDGGCVVMRRGAGVYLASRDSLFVANPIWWEGVRYQRDHERGQDSVEDLFSPGVFEWTTVPAAGTSSVSLDISCDAADEPSTLDDAAQSERRIAEHTRRAIVIAGGDAIADPDKQSIANLVRAADQFVVDRHEPDSKGTSIIAGYPWFSDWGRDAMIAMPGLLLATGRLDEARSMLETFARHRRSGLIPNRFEDSSGEAQFNTADASLLFIKAACEWADAAGESLAGDILDACLEIVDAYERGTDFGIRLESDGLITAGSESTQLTWMDAARDGRVYTPRHGKAIEINALWHHGLLSLAERLGSGESARVGAMREQGEACCEAINEKFWNEDGGFLFDCLEPDGDGRWEPVDELRPNQLFAIGVSHAPVDGERAVRALEAVERELLTTGGVRTLGRHDHAYRGRFEGTMGDRDAAYHNGTAWPWLIGPYADAVLRVRGKTPETLERLRGVVRPLLDAMADRCLGQIGEVFDGDDTPEDPTSEHGCVAQAWSVGETLRIMSMIAQSH